MDNKLSREIQFLKIVSRIVVPDVIMREYRATYREIKISGWISYL